MMENLDISNLDFEIPDLEIYNRPDNIVPFPAITVGLQNSYFNKPARKIINPGFYDISASTEYIVLLSADGRTKHSLKINHTSESFGLQMCAQGIRSYYSLRPGTYKLYKYKNGVAFKRYEPLTER